jgi:hypothetical protein
VRQSAELGEEVLWQVGGLVADLPEGLRPGEYTGHRHREHEHQGEPPAPLASWVVDLREDLQ